VKKRVPLILLGFLVVFAANVFGAQRDTQVTSSGKALPLHRSSYALVVGNGDYASGWEPLPGAVEDADEVRSFASSALKSLGYKTIAASNGLDALNKLKKGNGNIKLLLSDVIMPNMGGKELSEKIKKILPGIKILFTSGYTDNHIVQSGVLEKGINFIHKPYSFELLAKKVREVLDK